MKYGNNLSTDEILKRIFLLLPNYKIEHLKLNSFSDFRVGFNFISKSGELIIIYERRFKLLKEVSKEMTYKGWETLLEGLEKDPEKLIQVTGVDNLTTNILLVFTDIDVTEIIGILEKV